MRTISIIATLFAVATIQGCGGDDKPNNEQATSAVAALAVDPAKRDEKQKKTIDEFMALTVDDRKSKLKDYVSEQVKTDAGLKSLGSDKKFAEIEKLSTADREAFVTPFVTAYMKKFDEDLSARKPVSHEVADEVTSNTAERSLKEGLVR